jgi:glucan phosphoethanolaminetransferase (alkaline phosphatase superfamily)
MNHKSQKPSQMANLFITFLLIIVGLALTPTIASSVQTALASVTGAAAALLSLVPLFWVIIILAIGVAAVYTEFKAIS